MSKAAWFLIFLFPLFLTGLLAHDKFSPPQGPLDHSGNSFSINYQEPNPTLPPSYPTGTPEPRVLPPVGGNAGLVIGASILVLIIIGGVIFSSRKKGKG